LEDGSRDEVDGKINVAKRENTIQLIQSITNFQSTPYSLTPLEPLHSLLWELPFLDSETAFKVSSVLEPRAARRSDSSPNIKMHP
jgi:hypothetical protein